MKKVKLRDLRVRMGLSQKDIAEVLPTDISNYCRKENGEVKISMSEWKKIANYLKVPLEEIFENENFSHTTSKNSENNLNNVEHFIQVPIKFIEHFHDYIIMLRNENRILKEKLESR